MKQITPSELKEILNSADPDFMLLDVRTDSERAEKNIGGLHIPLDQLPSRVSEIDASKKIVVYCKGGGRSMKACGLLEQSGIQDVYNLSGGITAYLK